MIPIVDTHIHFWNRSVLHYPWFDSEGMAEFPQIFEPADVQNKNVVATVHVQAEMDHTHDPVAETAWLETLRQTSSTIKTPTVCVGYADLTGPDLSEILDRHENFDFFRGVRQEAWFDASSSRKDVLENDLLVDPRCIDGLRTLAKRDLSFDLLVFGHQLKQAADVFAQVPELRVVVDHLGMPEVATSLEQWKADLALFSERVPRSFIKVSGFSFIESPIAHPSVNSTVLTAIDQFGPSRTMLGSNFPIDEKTCTYDELWTMLDGITDRFNEGERRDIFNGTASRFYRIDASQFAQRDADEGLAR
ncbi:MAG: amidohydrolase family protein [Microbacteriaceae bacterium]